MDIHSILSPTLFIVTIVTIIVRSHNNDEESIFELFTSFIIGSGIFLILCFLFPVIYLIIFNESITYAFDPGLRETILFMQYYFTLFYYLTILYTTYINKD